MSLENKIILKIENSIITSIDIENEKIFDSPKSNKKY